MAKEQGMLMTCDRCGFQEFVKKIADEEMDGGYSQYTKFKPPQKPWGSINMSTEASETCGRDFRDLCPKCLREKDSAKKTFWESYGKGDSGT